MKRIFSFLLLTTSALFSSAPPECSIKIDMPSFLLKNAIDVTTGRLAFQAADALVAGREPIPVARTYVSNDRASLSWEGGWLFYPHTQFSLHIEGNSVRAVIKEPNGMSVTYTGGAGASKLKPDLDLYNYAPTINREISGRTDLRNHRLIFERQSSWAFPFTKATLVLGNGGARFYLLKADESSPHAHTYVFELVEERLPNGNLIAYKNNQGRIAQIKTHNPANSKEYACVDFYYEGDDKYKNRDFKAKCSDGKSIEYKFYSYLNEKYLENYFFLNSVTGNVVEEVYSYDRGYKKSSEKKIEERKRAKKNAEEQKEKHKRDKDANRRKQIEEKVRDRREKHEECKAYNKIRGPSISDQKIGGSDFLAVDYYRPYKNFPKFSDPVTLKADDAHCGKIKDLKEPVNSDGSMKPTHSFKYGDYTTEVKDVQGNETHYSWGYNHQPTAVSFYSKGTLIRSDRLIWTKPEIQFLSSDEEFFWDGYDVKWHLTIDPSGKNSVAKHFEYIKGNVVKETFYGNLSGICPVSFDPNTPEKAGVETYSVEYQYSKDGFNLPILRREDSGLTFLYTYKKGTDLPTSKFVCDGNQVLIRHFYSYDPNDNFLQEEIVDDGVGREPNDLSKITERKIVRYTPNEKNFPWIIREYAFDLETGKEALLQKKVLHYTPRCEVEKVEVYFGEDEKLYEINSTYSNWRLESETDPLGIKTTFGYNAKNLMSARHKEGGPQETFLYKPTGQIAQTIAKDLKTNVSKTTTIEYDDLQHPQSETDSYGSTIFTSFDRFGNLLTKTIENSTDSAKYDYAGRVIYQKDPKGHATLTAYNARGAPIEIIHPTGKETFVYYLNGNVKEHTDPDGIKTEYTYDVLGRVITKKVYNLDGTVFAEETNVYNSFHLVSTTDSCQFKTVYEYDLAGRKKSETREGRKITFSYDKYGNLERTTRGTLVAVTERDPKGQILQERLETADGKILEKRGFTYNKQGLEETQTRYYQSGESVYTTKYNAFGEVTERTDPNGVKTTVDYTLAPHTTTLTDPLGRKKIETFNARGKIASLERQDRSGHTIALEKYDYDPSGNLEKQTSTLYFEGRLLDRVFTKWEYGPGNRLEEWIEAYGTPIARKTMYKHSPKGLLAKVFKPDGDVLEYGYDPLGFLRTLKSLDSSIHYFYEHNRLGVLESAIDLNTGQKTVRKVDAFGNVEKEELANGFVLRKACDALNQCIWLFLPDTTLVEKTYEGTHLKEIIRRDEKEQRLYSHQFQEYDLSGNLLQEKLPLNGGQVTYQIDELGRLKALHAPYFDQTIDEIDQVGKIKKMTAKGVSTQFDYDDLGQLIQENAETFGYDSEYNRRKHNDEELEVDDLYQLKRAAQIEFTHDPCGNVKTKKTPNGVSFFEYDALDRLIYFKDARGVETFYTYDPLHRRITKTTDNSTTRFLYDGQNEIGFEKEGKLSLRILGHTPFAEIGAAVAIETNGHVHIPIHDLQGNLAVLYDPHERSVIYENRYTAFGVEETASALNPWRYLSKHADAESGLIYFGRRYYDPSIGRWLTTDPKGYTDSMNLYTFALNDPFMLVDPYGLFSMPSWVSDAYNDPRFQGGLEAWAGYQEMQMGIGLCGTGTLGWIPGSVLLFHGADYFSAGVSQVISGQYQQPVTPQLLQLAEISPKYAFAIDGLLGFAGPLLTKGIQKASFLGGLFKSANHIEAHLLSIESKIARQQFLNELSRNSTVHKVTVTTDYRRNLIKYLGFDPGKAAQAHHIFPQQHRNDFIRVGINVDDPRFLSWIDKEIHNRMHRNASYNDIWAEFLARNPSKDDILNKGRDLASGMGFYAGF